MCTIECLCTVFCIEIMRVEGFVNDVGIAALREGVHKCG